MDSKKEYTIIFLVDALPPTKIVLMERGMGRWASGWSTGIGGNIEPGETALEGALRELKEETEPSIENVQLTEFGRAVINDKEILYYFFGIFPYDILPDSSVGEISWVSVDKIFANKITPQTMLFLKTWCRRFWSVNRPFTVFIEQEGEHLEAKFISIRVVQGLLDQTPSS